MGSLVNDEVEPKFHIVCVPYPAQGHIKPMFQLAKLLHAQGRFHITFVLTQYNHRRLLRSRGPNAADGLQRFKFETIPDGLPPSDADVTQDIPTLCHSVMTTFLDPFKSLLRKLNDPSSGSPGPVTCIISDSVMPFTLDAAHEIGNIPLIWLWTASVCGFLGYSQYRPLLDKRLVPFQDEAFLTDGSLEKTVDWIPNSLEDMQLKYIPSFIRTTNKDDIMFNFLLHCVETTAKSSAPVIFNSFHAFEKDVLSDVSELVSGPVYTVGPLDILVNATPTDDPATDSLGSNLWKEDSKCLNWLDSKPPNSVILVSFGSIATITKENLLEFAWGLANSNHFFMWVLRPDLVDGENSVIPNEFLMETEERGLITSWCDQETVLKHKSLGGYLTHCGWNSTLDTVCGGVPVLCWPFFAEQQTNCWFSCGKWGIGMEIDGSVERMKVEKQVREIMGTEKGAEMRRNAMEWKRLAEEAVERPKGSSYFNFNKLVTDVLLPMNQLGK